MRQVIASVVLTVLAAIPGLAATHTSSIDFSPGNSLLFKLRGGDLHIKRGRDPLHILVRYTPDAKKPDEEHKVQLRSEVRGAQIQIEVEAPRSLSVDAEVEVPSPLTLEVRMTAGDLSVEGVEGDKNLNLFAGDLTVNIATLQDLGNVEVSVGIGDISVPAVGETHGWLGHKWKYKGSGTYRLYAHTSFGDARLHVQEQHTQRTSPEERPLHFAFEQEDHVRGAVVERRSSERAILFYNL